MLAWAAWPQREKRWGAFLADPNGTRWLPRRARMASSSENITVSC